MEELLPVGSIVMLKGATRKTVIMGIFQFKNDQPDRFYDYLGVPYPEGYMGPGSSFLFNHENITEVIFRGYEDQEREKMIAVVKPVYESAQKAVQKADAQ